MATFPLGTLKILLLSAAVLRFSFALSLVDNSRLTLKNPSNTTIGTLVTGRSPCARAVTLLLRRRPHPQCLSDPDTRDEAKSMHPVSCTRSVDIRPGYVIASLIDAFRSRRAECELIAKGYFSQDVPSLRLTTNITSDIAGEPSCILLIKDDFCAWAHVVQGRAPSCPPKKGTAVVTFTTLLMQGWIPEAKYGVEIKVDAGDLLELPTDSPPPTVPLH